MIQGTDEWFAARLGIVTASRVADVMARTKTGWGASRKNYMMQLLCERLTGKVEDSYSNAAMQRGTEMEPFARSAYEMANGVLVIETGFVKHTAIGMGASPDGLVGDDGLIEIKCPNTAQHVEFIRTDSIEGKYQLQMLCQMACTGRQWCDFVSFDDRMPEGLDLVIKRFDRDETRINEMLDCVAEFNQELDELESELRHKMDRAA